MSGKKKVEVEEPEALDGPAGEAGPGGSVGCAGDVAAPDVHPSFTISLTGFVDGRHGHKEPISLTGTAIPLGGEVADEVDIDLLRFGVDSSEKLAKVQPKVDALLAALGVETQAKYDVRKLKLRRPGNMGARDWSSFFKALAELLVLIIPLFMH